MEYRDLEVGEVTRMGDQYRYGKGEWFSVPGSLAGTLSASSMEYRRPVEVVQTSDRSYEVHDVKPVVEEVADGKCKNCSHEMRLPQMGLAIDTIKCVKCAHIFIRATWRSEYRRPLHPEHTEEECDVACKPCPFCGESVDMEESTIGFKVNCWGCGVSLTDGNHTREAAVEIWNKRVKL